MFNLFGKKSAPSDTKAPGKEAFVNTLCDRYLQLSFKNLGEEKLKEAIRGKFPTLKYTLSGYDPSGMSYPDKVELINILFDLNVQKNGMAPAKEDLEKTGLQVKERLGVEGAFADAVADLPSGVFSVHRIDNLSEEQLREKLKEATFELEKARSLANKSTAEKTVELAAEKDVLEAVLYNTSDGVYALDRQGRIVTFNKAMEDLTGFSANEVDMKLADEVIRLFEESSPLELRRYCALSGVSTEVPSYSNDKVTLVARNGGKKYVHMSSSTITDSREVNIGCIVTLKDVTKDIELETMKLDFVSMAAHELRTPLTAMRGYLSFLNDDIKESLDETHREYLEKATISADQLHILIENLLNISRIERGTLVLEKSKENWLQLVNEVVESHQADAKAAGLTLALAETPSTLPEVDVDKTMISEVLTNLLDNAIRYTDEGGRVEVVVEESDGKVITHIKDTGIGIPQAAIPHLFKKFYRVSTVLKEGRKGTGLGLFISKEIMKLHNGDIWVESTEGKGSTFSFGIPVEGSVAATPDAKEQKQNG